ncbi:superkiller complex protein 3 isoform X2 [Xylocopa sonorina]|uniref:superkiller complex protein 3 isoform X2 n=1 Tax=Xylocopa sonorina TaxID=1818115 RepID=UPI00403ACDC9
MSNEIKISLKEARNIFKEKNYKGVIKKCKTILKRDQNNYNALVLLAAAMKEIEEYKSQVQIVLEKAVKIRDDNPIAWQGLITYYEQNLDNDDCYDKLILAYCKLLQIESDSTFTHILNKISELSLQLKNSETFIQCIEHLKKLQKKLDSDKAQMIDKTLKWILIDNFNDLNKYQDSLENIFKSIINDLDVNNQQNLYRKYLQKLYDKKELVTLVSEATNMHQRFPQDMLPLEYICRIYCDQHVLDESITDINIEEFYESLLKLNKESEIATVAKAIHLEKSDNLITAREILKDLLTLETRSLYGWMALCEISMRLYCWDDAEIAAKRTLEVKDHKIKDELLYKIELMLLESVSRSTDQSKWEIALQMCERMHPSTQLELIRARIIVLMNKSDAICIMLDDLESKCKSKIGISILRALYLKQNKKFDEALNVLDSDIQTSEAWLLLGTIYWEMAEYNYSLIAFLNGIKVDRYNWKCLVYLGHYYCQYGNDVERSRRCYQTALQINPSSEEAGIGLSTAYRLLKNQDANMKLLQTLTTQDNGPKWAWLQLGLQYLDQGNANQAIKAFQHVIRADPNDNYCWESLADAYFVRGAYTSALKSYQKVLELCPKSLYPMIQLANIKLIVGQYSEAKEDFQCILKDESCYIPALKGLAESCLALAKEHIANQFLGRGKNYLQQALDSLTTAVKERKDISCIWKLLGDVCFRVAMLPEKYSYMNVSSILLKQNDIESVMLVKQQDLFSLSTRCYCCALSISPQSDLLWHDLALCYLMQLQSYPLIDHKNLGSKCLAAAKHAIKLNPAVWIHWNLLGVICMSPYIKNYALAQHAYIMAIDKELNNATLWSNLGTLYLHTGSLYKANAAYSQAQSAYPAYINSWVGQAIIAETMNRREAMDLFRHALQLGYHGQAAVGYTNWVLNVILNCHLKMDALYTYIMENMHAILVATDAMTRYIEYHPNDCYAQNAYGLLLERQKLYKPAAEQFVAGLCNSNNDERDLISINLARVFTRLGKYEEAMKLCQAVTNINYNSECHLALALFKAGLYEESYTTYESALHSFASTEIEKACTLCAMAAIVYTFQRVDDAKTLLFQCMQIQPPVIIGHLAAASLGILHGDVNLTTLVLNELKMYKNHPEYGHHVVNLSAYFYLIQNNIKGAIIVLSKAIFMHPGDVKHWIRLVRILFETDTKKFNTCARKVLFLNRNIAVENVAHVACALSLNCSMPSNIRSVQKLLFAYPANIESWATFIAALLPRCINKKYNIKSEWLSGFITITQQNYRPTNLMAKWLNDSKIKLKHLN